MFPRSSSPERARALLFAFAIAAVPAAAEEPVAAGGPAGFTPGAHSPREGEGDAELPELPEIVIVGRPPRSQAQGDPTASATVISADAFAGEAKNVAALVATAPGVAVNEYGGLGHLATVNIRGATADGVLVLVDGLPLDPALGGGVDLASIPRAWIERIEVIRGAEGAHYGAGAMGGVVNVITRGAARGGWSVETSGGSFGTFALSADGVARVGGGTLFASGSAETSDGGFPYRFDPQPNVAGNALVDEVRANDGVVRAGGMLKGAWTFGAARLDAAAQAFAGRRELPGSPYALTPRDWQEDAHALLAARLSAPGPRAGLLLATRASLRLDRVDARVDPSTARQRGAAGALQAEARLAHWRDGLLRVALDAEREELRADGLGESRGRTTLAASLSEDLAVGGGRARLAPAVRAERVGDFSGVSAKLGASLRIAGPLALRASAGRTFRAPSFSELYLAQGLVQPNPELHPEEGLGADAGLVLEHPVAFAALGTHATLYRDLIFYEPASLGRLKPFNAGRALVRGLEAEAALAPVSRLAGFSVSGSYTFLHTRTLRGVEGAIGKWLPHRARHRLYARISVAPGPAEAHAEAHVVGRQYADSRNLREISAATTWNAGASVRLARRHSLRLHAEVRNLLDDRTLQDPLGNPLPSRTVLLTLRAGSAPTERAP